FPRAPFERSEADRSRTPTLRSKPAAQSEASTSLSLGETLSVCDLGERSGNRVECSRKPNGRSSIYLVWKDGAKRAKTGRDPGRDTDSTMKTNLLFAGLAAGALSTAPLAQGDSAGAPQTMRIDFGSASQLPDPGANQREYLGTVSEVNATSRTMVVQD